MGVFEHFPYTNFHDLNLDRILERTQEAEEAVETSAQQALTAETAATQAAESASAAMSSAAQAASSAATAVITAQQAVSNMVMPMLFIDIDLYAASGNQLHWYNGSLNGAEITSERDLYQFLNTGSDADPNNRTSAMVRVYLTGYATGHLIEVYNASICRVVRAGTNIYYAIILDVFKASDNTLHQLIFRTDVNSISSFTMTDTTIA